MGSRSPKKKRQFFGVPHPTGSLFVGSLWCMQKNAWADQNAFGGLTHVCPTKHVLYGGSRSAKSIHHRERWQVGNFGTQVSTAKMAKLIYRLFGKPGSCGPNEPCTRWVKGRQINSLPRGVTGWQCGLLSKFFDHPLLSSSLLTN